MKTTIELAREAAGDDWNLFQEFMPEIHRLAELVRADEREACAKVCESTPKLRAYENNRAIQDECAAAIRARSKT
jgi:hypothetical protein